MKETFKERLKKTGKLVLYMLLGFLGVACFAFITYILPFNFIFKDALQGSDYTNGVFFDCVFVFFAIFCPLYCKIDDSENKAILIVMSIILALFGFLPNVINSPNFINCEFSINAIVAFTYFIIPAILFLIIYIYIGAGIQNVWLITFTPSVVSLLSCGIISLLCLNNNLTAFLVSLFSYPTLVIIMIILCKKLGSITRGAGMWGFRSNTKPKETYRTINEPTKETNPPKQNTTKPSNKTEKESDDQYFHLTIENIVKSASYDVTFSNGWISYYSNYAKKIREDEYDIKVYVNVYCREGATEQQVKYGLDSFTDQLFDRLESRLDQYDIGFSLQIEVNKIEEI